MKTVARILTMLAVGAGIQGALPGQDHPPASESRVQVRQFKAQGEKLRVAGQEKAARDARKRLAPLRNLPARLAAFRALPPEEIKRRIHHVEMAVENLRAARLPEIAERLELVARRMRGALPPAAREEGLPQRPRQPLRLRQTPPRAPRCLNQAGEPKCHHGARQERREQMERQRHEIERAAEQVERQRRELEERGEQMERQRHEIERAAEEVERQRRELEERREQMERQRHEIERAAEQVERQRRELEERGEQMERRRAELRRIIAEQREQIERRSREPRAEREPREGREPPPPPEEIERRLHHVKAAIENLHAAEIHGPAERLEPLAARLLAALKQAAHPAPPERPPEIAELRQRMNELETVLQRLAERVDRLSEAVEKAGERR